jgi:hypothetical protein
MKYLLTLEKFESRLLNKINSILSNSKQFYKDLQKVIRGNDILFSKLNDDMFEVVPANKFLNLSNDFKVGQVYVDSDDSEYEIISIDEEYLTCIHNREEIKLDINIENSNNAKLIELISNPMVVKDHYQNTENILFFFKSDDTYLGTGQYSEEYSLIDLHNSKLDIDPDYVIIFDYTNVIENDSIKGDKEIRDNRRRSRYDATALMTDNKFKSKKKLG